MNTPDAPQEPETTWSVRRRRDSDPVGAPPVTEVLRAELDRIDARIQDVRAKGRASFREGSESYDRATVAILRLAALFEEERFAPSLAVVTDEERRGITTTRNIAAHSGYGAMNAEVFWRTVTERVPDVVARIRAALDD